MNKDDIKFAFLLGGITLFFFGLFMIQIIYINSGGN